ncbi:MAG: hypothetical protein AAGA54_06040 [Myxococcota bacterium]
MPQQHLDVPSRTSSIRNVPLLGMVVAGSVLTALTGCPSPDTAGRFDGFVDETQEERDEAATVKMDVGGSLADVTGTFHFSLTPTPVSSTTPFQFIAETTFTPTDDGGGELVFDLQPLSLDVGSTSSPREFVGSVITVTTQVDAGGAFMQDLGEVTLEGAANPITGSNILATLQLTGAIQDEDVYCGIVNGMVTMPISLDLSGSTFAAVRINPEDAMNPAALADPPVGACPEGGGGGGGGGSEGSGGDTDSSTGG